MKTATPYRAALAALIAAAAVASAQPSGDGIGSARELREKHGALEANASTPFDLPLYLSSSQQENALRGDVHSRLDHRYETVREALRRPSRWCEILIVHPNVKGCRVIGAASTGTGKLDVLLGRAEHPVEFAFRIAAIGDDYLDVRLDAPKGPAGTTDYRIRVQAAPLDAGRTLLHLAYSQSYGVQARVAMNAYFSTLGRDKVGFSVTGRGANGEPELVGDLRGGIERNVMRYYLAIRSHLEVLTLPPAQRVEQGLRRFVGYTERWPLQLREAPDFVDLKSRDIARMRAAS